MLVTSKPVLAVQPLFHAAVTLTTSTDAVEAHCCIRNMRQGLLEHHTTTTATKMDVLTLKVFIN